MIPPIVLECREVWEEVLEYAEMEPPTPPMWLMKINEEILIDEADVEGEEWKKTAVPLDDRILEGACPVSMAATEAALLGLGVKWLLKHIKSATIYSPIDNDPSYWAYGMHGAGIGDSDLAAVYGAIKMVMDAKA